MANIIPFRGFRYHLSDSRVLKKVLAPPYDVITPTQKKELLAADPRNVIRLIIGNPSHERHSSTDYQKAKKTFESWRQNLLLKREDKPAIYVYRQTFTLQGRIFYRTGFVGLSGLTPIGNKKWERRATAPEKRYGW